MKNLALAAFMAMMLGPFPAPASAYCEVLLPLGNSIYRSSDGQFRGAVIGLEDRAGGVRP